MPAGYVIHATISDGQTVGLIQQYGNFPRNASGQDAAWEDAPLPKDGKYPFAGYNVSDGQSVLFDVAQGTYGPYATNIRVA